MGPMLSSNNIRTLTHKVLLFSIAFASVAVVTELTVPLLLNFALNDFPAVWSTINSWVKPPYLYLLINIIILTISFTTYFHQQDDQSQPSNLLQAPTEASFGVFDTVTWFYDEGQPERKRIKTGPDGNRAQNVAIEATVEDDDGHRNMPPIKHFQKSVTFENHREEMETTVVSKKKKVVRKSVTLKDRTNYDHKNHRPLSQPSPESGGAKRKDGSLSNDELNRRVEEFIKKFNHQMRLQRQESVRHYTEFTNHRSYR